jgi:hypothetical protein
MEMDAEQDWEKIGDGDAMFDVMHTRLVPVEPLPSRIRPRILLGYTV